MERRDLPPGGALIAITLVAWASTWSIWGCPGCLVSDPPLIRHATGNLAPHFKIEDLEWRYLGCDRCHDRGKVSTLNKLFWRRPVPGRSVP